MEVTLIKWDKSLKDELIRICNSVDRSYLSERIPDPSQNVKCNLEVCLGEDGKYHYKEV